MRPIIYHNTNMSKDPKAFWRAYFDCLHRDEQDGIATTDDERQRFARMWERGNVVWRDDGQLMSLTGLSPHMVPDAVGILSSLPRDRRARMTEMEEKVARAILAKLAEDHPRNWCAGDDDITCITLDGNFDMVALGRAAIEAVRPDIVRLLRTATVNMPPDLAEKLVDAALSPEKTGA